MPINMIQDPPKLNVKEGMSWITDILKQDYSDKEQRIALRTIPRQTFTYQYIIKTAQRRRELYSEFATALKELWYIPVWTEARTSVPLLSGQSTVYVDTRYSDFNDSSYAMIWQNNELYELLEVSTVADNTLTLSTPNTNTYTSNTFVMPVKTGYIRNSPRVVSLKNGLGLMDVDYEIIDNERISDYSASQEYDGYEVVVRGSRITENEGVDELHNGELTFIDNNTGLLGIEAKTTYNVVTQNQYFEYRTAATIWDFKQWLHSLYGRQNPFLVPSYTKDLTLSRTISSSDNTIYFSHIDLSANVSEYDLLQYIGFLNSDNTIRVRKIDNIVEIDPTEEAIGLTTTVGDDYSISTTVMFVWRCRLSNDDLQLEWQEKDRLICQSGFVRVLQ